MSGRKRTGSGGVKGTSRKRRAIAKETKVKIIMRLDQDEMTEDAACSYNMNCSTIGMILKGDCFENKGVIHAIEQNEMISLQWKKVCLLFS